VKNAQVLELPVAQAIEKKALTCANRHSVPCLQKGAPTAQETAQPKLQSFAGMVPLNDCSAYSKLLNLSVRVRAELVLVQEPPSPAVPATLERSGFFVSSRGQGQDPLRVLHEQPKASMESFHLFMCHGALLLPGPVFCSW